MLCVAGYIMSAHRLAGDMPWSTFNIGKDGAGEGLEKGMHVFGTLFKAHSDVVSVRDFREADADGLTERSARLHVCDADAYSIYTTLA